MNSNNWTKSIIFGFFLVVLTFGFISCADPMADDPDDWNETVVMPITADIDEDEVETRTVLPSDPSSDIASYVLTGKTTGETVYETLGTFSTLTGASVEIETGSWDFKLQALDDSSTVLLEAGKTNVTVAAGAAVNFTLRPLSSGSGSFEITLTLPGGHPVSSIETKLDTTVVTPALSLSDDTLTFSKSGVAAGEYLVSFKFFDSSSDQVGSTYTQIIRVAPNLTSTLSETLSSTYFDTSSVGSTSASISATIDVGSELSINFSPSSTTVAKGDDLTVSATEIEGASYKWYLEGSELTGETSRTVTVATASLDYRNYELVLAASKDGVTTSKRMTFMVNDGTTTEKDWTILVYLDADNDLEAYGIVDMNEMEAGLYSAQQNDSSIMDKLNVVVQIDRIEGYDTSSHDSGSDWTDARRYLMQPDSADSTDLTSTKVSELGEVNMGDANVLKDFVSWGKSSYPAEHYALVIWNHGGGVRSISDTEFSPSIKGSAYDTTSDDDFIFTGELSDVLTASESVDLLGFDACLMGMAEVAYEYRPGRVDAFGADYFVAAPHTEQGNGWPYNENISRVAADRDVSDPGYDVSTMSAAELAGILVKEYGDFCESVSPSDALTALDNSKIEGVRTALDAFSALATSYQTPLETIRGSHSSYTPEGGTVGTGPVTMDYFDGEASYDGNTPWYGTPHFDLYDFADRVSSDGNLSSLSTAAATLKTAVDDAVIYSWGGSHYDAEANGGTAHVDGKHGLGFFFPAGDFKEEGYSNDWAYISAFYTNSDYSSSSGSYGKLDFLSLTDDSTVNTWYELLDYWFAED